MCHVQQSVAYLQGQGHNLRSKIEKVCYILAMTFIDQVILKLFGINVHNNKMMCHA
jgi:hypothetical protein